MAEQSGFFDAHLVDGEYDRVYLAENFAKYFSSFIGNGIFAGKSNELMVRQQNSPNMSIKVLPGQGWINGYYYENDNELTLSFDTADGVLNRIDIIVLRWNNSQRVIRLAIKKGTTATRPIAPILQRDDDIYELKLAEISVKAGATSISQTNITDTRLDSSVCGFVHAVVEQLDASEFSAQLNDFIVKFIADNNAWFAAFKTDSESAVSTLISTNQTKINTLLSTGRSDIDNAIAAGNTRLDKIISDHNTEFNEALARYKEITQNGEVEINRLIEELEGAISNSDVAKIQTSIQGIASQLGTLSSNVSNIKTNLASATSSISTIRTEISTINAEIASIRTSVVSLSADVTKLKNLFIESGSNAGCYYRVVTENDVSINEWVNPPGEIGIEYRLTERWFGNPVYQKSFYVGALPNKTMMAIEINGVNYRNIIFISGFAVDSENNMFHPFPIIINGLAPVAVIQSAEGNGEEQSLVIIQTNDDISHMYGCITIKYTKL